jgi:succinate dehydrogenase/fumarate reductase cytochrome b subunit
LIRDSSAEGDHPVGPDAATVTSGPATSPSSSAPPSTPSSTAGAARPSMWAALSGIVILVYVVVYAATLTQIAGRNRFNRWGAAMGSLGARLVICAVVLATLFHSLDGLRRLLAQVAPATVAHEVRLRAAVLFVTWAVAIPSFAAIVWPWISETTR